MAKIDPLILILLAFKLAIMIAMLLVILLMNTNRKRGPKPSGEKKVVFYARVPEEYYERLESYLESGCPLGIATASDVIKGGREPESCTPIVPDSTILSAQSTQISALLDNIQELTDERDGLRLELEEAKLMAYDE